MKKKKYTWALTVIFLLVVLLLGSIFRPSVNTVENKWNYLNEILAQSPNIKTLIDLQDTKWSEIILEIDCSILENLTQQEICFEEQERFREVFDTPGWEDVTYLSIEEIAQFNCQTISELWGRKKCLDLQQTIK